MSTQTSSTTVQQSIVVDAPIDRAFHVFTEEIGTWWPKDHHLIAAEFEYMVFETRVGGHIYDRGVDGSECRWARVLEFEPPSRFVISWDINVQWQLETDHSRTSEVEVRFDAEGPTQTRVTLEHRHLDRHDDRWEEMRDSVGATGGWTAILTQFVARVAA